MGPVARVFRETYVGGQAPERLTAASPEIDGRSGAASVGEPRPGDAEPLFVERMDPDLVGTRPRVWAPAGTPIYKLNDVGSPVLTRTEYLVPLDLLDRRGDWFRVRFGARMSGQYKGWVFLENYREPTREELWAPAPLSPLASVTASEEIVALARASMADGGRAAECGPYRLLSDVGLLEGLCAATAARAEETFALRYGVVPIGPPGEVIFVFGSTVGYETFRDAVAPTANERAHAFPARGYMAFAARGMSGADLEHTLLHELGHLISRRAWARLCRPGWARA